MKKLLVAIFFLISSSVMAQPAIGLELISVRTKTKTDLPGTLKKLSEWGVKELEGGVPQGMEPAEFVQLVKSNNMTLVATGSEFVDLETDPQKVVDRAKALGVKQVICYWIPHTDDNFTVEDAKRGVTVFNKAGELLSKSGLAFAYHPHGYEFRPYESGTLFDYLMKNTDPRYANFQMDVFWIKQSGTDPVALLKKYPDRFISMHLKDRRKGTPDSINGRVDVEVNVVLGSGDVDIPAIVKAGQKAGIKHFFIEDESSRQWEQVPQSIAFVRTIK